MPTNVSGLCQVLTRLLSGGGEGPSTWALESGPTRRTSARYHHPLAGKRRNALRPTVHAGPDAGRSWPRGVPVDMTVRGFLWGGLPRGEQPPTRPSSRRDRDRGAASRRRVCGHGGAPTDRETGRHGCGAPVLLPARPVS